MGEANGAPGGADTDVEMCSQCGERIETSDWYPVRADRAADGSLQLYPFCSEGCQDDWLAGRDD